MRGSPFLFSLQSLCLTDRRRPAVSRGLSFDFDLRLDVKFNAECGPSCPGLRGTDSACALKFPAKDVTTCAGLGGGGPLPLRSQSKVKAISHGARGRVGHTKPRGPGAEKSPHIFLSCRAFISFFKKSLFTKIIKSHICRRRGQNISVGHNVIASLPLPLFLRHESVFLQKNEG